MQVRCPQCHTPVELARDEKLADIACPSCGSSFSLLADAETTPYEAGTRTIGHFDLVEKVGVGTFGYVWKARDTELDRTVALKVPRKGQLDPEETEQFLREARAAAQLRHPNIVSVHEVGRERDTVFIVSDFVEGVTLADRLTAQSFSVREEAELCATIADALHHAHEAGVIHRDLKPGNIILDAQGEPHIMDFGLARREAGEVTMTVEGRVLGTPAYMSPEQAKGAAHTADRRTDVYSLGVILFEMLTGERPFRGNIRMLVHQVINDEPPSPRRLNGAVPRDLETICLKCLEKEPGSRYHTAGEVASELRRFLCGDPIHARPISRLRRVGRWCRRKPAVTSLILMGVLAVAGLISVPTAFYSTQVQHNNTLLEEQRRTLVALRESKRQAAVSSYFNSQTLCEQRQIVRGLLRMAQGLQLSVEAESPALERAFRWNLDAWLREIHGQAFVLPHSALVHSVAFSPDGRFLAVGCANGNVHLWKLPDGLATETTYAHPGAVTALTFDFKGETLLTGCDDGVVRCWEVATGHLRQPLYVHSLPAHDGLGSSTAQTRVTGLAMSGDGRRLLTVGGNRKLRFWRLGSDDPVEPPQSEPIDKAVWARDSRTVVSLTNAGIAAGQQTVIFWDVETGKPVRNFRVGFNFNDLDASPSSDHILLAHRDAHCAFRLDANTGEVLGSPLRHLWEGRLARYSPDGTLIVTTAIDGTARVWDAITGEPMGTPILHATSPQLAVFSPDSTFLATSEGDETVRIWHVSRTTLLWALKVQKFARSVVFSPDGESLFVGLAGSHGKNICKWDMKTGRQVLFDCPPLGWVQDLLISQDGKLLYTHTGEDHETSELRSFNADTGQQLSTLLRNPRYFQTGVAMSPNGKALLVADSGGVHLWDSQNGARIGIPIKHGNLAQAVAFSPDGQTVVTGGDDSAARFWDAATCQPVAPPMISDNEIICVAFHPQGKILATAGLDNTVVLWDLTTRKRIGTAMQHSCRIHRVLFIAGGHLVATCSQDNTARLWHVETGFPVGPVFEHQRGVWGLACTREGKLLATGSDDGTARVWVLPCALQGDPGEVQALLQRRTGMKYAENGAMILFREDVGRRTNKGTAASSR